MPTAAPAPSDLERRKLVRLRLRADLSIEAQKYEGRTYYVVKDPVSMRYYRLKDHEHFLVRYMDGKHTLEDAQKAYETRYRPDRLKLEELEGFAQQLLTAGLAQNESPKAGKQLFDRRKKRKRSEWMQTLTNILYIKLPVFDPDWLLTRMVPYLGFVFTLWFFFISCVLMFGAVMEVATHFETFRAKLPDYHAFFNVKSVFMLWIALGVVKVIHEFGHGISCKTFGGEVHEMGALLLCFSPALYCNVSDAWTLPNKWHRIIISAAGIYVELVIAALATFVWLGLPQVILVLVLAVALVQILMQQWRGLCVVAGVFLLGFAALTYLPPDFVRNMSLSLMVVCSVSTVVFNANPLMRYDGYYVLADWIEIPNLRERANRYLTNLVLEHCLGVEVPPEEYMALWRRCLFVLYAVVSYVYRWVVTFTILFFFRSFLKPYGLEVIGDALAVASLASMLGWPLYRLCKNIHRRGRLPDMKRWRVVASATAVVAVLLVVCFVPLPINRIRGLGLVQPHPDAQTTLYVTYPGFLKELKVRPGQTVHAGDELAEFTNPDLEYEIRQAETDVKNYQSAVADNERRREGVVDAGEKASLDRELAGSRTQLRSAKEKYELLDEIRRKKFVLVAPADGVIGIAPNPNDIGKYYDVDQEQQKPFCTIDEPRRVRVCLPVLPDELNQLREYVELPSPAAAATIRRLRADKITVQYEKRPLGEVLADLQQKVEGLKISLDPGSSNLADLPVTYEAKKQPVATVLDRVFAKEGLGYVVTSDRDGDQDGAVVVRPGQERMFPDGPRPLADVPVKIRIQGREDMTWKGKILILPESEAKEIPLPLSSQGGGPVAVKAEKTKTGGLLPQTQYYLVYVDILDPDDAIAPGSMAQVKIHCKSQTCLKWVWRSFNNKIDLRLLWPW